MGYFKRNRIVYHGVKGERIYSNNMKRKKKRVYLGAESYEDQKVKDLVFAIILLSIGLCCILSIIIF